MSISLDGESHSIKPCASKLSPHDRTPLLFPTPIAKQQKKSDIVESFIRKRFKKGLFIDEDVSAENI